MIPRVRISRDLFTYPVSVCLCGKVRKIEVFYFHYLRKYKSRLLQTEIWMFLLRV